MRALSALWSGLIVMTFMWVARGNSKVDHGGLRAIRRPRTPAHGNTARPRGAPKHPSNGPFHEASSHQAPAHACGGARGHLRACCVRAAAGPRAHHRQAHSPSQQRLWLRHPGRNRDAHHLGGPGRRRRAAGRPHAHPTRRHELHHRQRQGDRALRGRPHDTREGQLRRVERWPGRDIFLCAAACPGRLRAR